jgi:ABC-type nitrate/sulfonate/bicarbonate transport system permease component
VTNMKALGWNLGGVAAVAILIELSMKLGWSSTFLPTPSAVVRACVSHSNALWASAYHTVFQVVSALSIGVPLGVGLGYLLGYFRYARLLIAPHVLLLSTIPVVTFVPLLVVYLGVGRSTIVAAGALAAFFPSFIASSHSIDRVGMEYIEVARDFCARPAFILRRVVLPGSVPFTIAGVRASIQVCFLVTPVVDMLLNGGGLGALIWRSADLFRLDLVVAGQIALGLCGLCLFRALSLVDKHLLSRWMHNGEQP